MSERPLHPGPGPKNSPRQTVIGRFWRGRFAYVHLDCGHSVHHTKEFDFKEGIKVRCGQCPRKK